MSYQTFLVRTESGQSVTVGVEELLRILLSGELPDGTAFDGVKVQASGTFTVDATGQGDVPVTLDGETVATTSRSASSDHVSMPASNTAAQITLSGAGAGVRNVISAIYWSYVGDTPSGGSLSVTDDGTAVFAVGISDQGPGFIPFDPPRNFGDNTDVVVTLSAAGGGIVGRLNLSAWTE